MIFFSFSVLLAKTDFKTVSSTLEVCYRMVKPRVSVGRDYTRVQTPEVMVH